MSSDSHTLLISDSLVNVPTLNSVTNDSVAADAAIAFNKLASLTSGNIIVGNSSNVPTSVAVTGDVTISNTGVTSIATGSIVNADINSSAGIAHSKLATTTAGNVLIGNSAGSVTGTPITGDISVSPTGAATINNNAVALSKLQTINDQRIIGRNIGIGEGEVQSIPCTSYAYAILNSATASVVRSELGLGSISIRNSNDVNITGGTIEGVTLSSFTLGATSGGTGLKSYTVGDVLYANSTESLSRLSDTKIGNSLLSNGISEPPLYGKIGLTTHVSGTLPVSNGGTDATTLTGYIKGDGTNPMTANPTVPVSDISGTLPASNGGTGATTLTGYVKGNGTSAMTAVAKIPASDIDGAIAETSVDLESSTGTLPVSNGGTGATTLTGYIKGDGTNPMTANPTVPVSDLSGTLGVSNGGTGAAILTGYVRGNGINQLTATDKIPASDIEFSSNLDIVTGILPVSKGGTGSSIILNGYIKGNGQDNLTSVSKIPAEDVEPLSVSSVNLDSVTGVLPPLKGGLGYKILPYAWVRVVNQSTIDIATPWYLREYNTGADNYPSPPQFLDFSFYLNSDFEFSGAINYDENGELIGGTGIKYTGAAERRFVIAFSGRYNSLLKKNRMMGYGLTGKFNSTEILTHRAIFGWGDNSYRIVTISPNEILKFGFFAAGQGEPSFNYDTFMEAHIFIFPAL